MPAVTGVGLAERARNFRHELQVILSSGRESDGHGFPLIRNAIAEIRSASRDGKDGWALLRGSDALQRKNGPETQPFRVEIDFNLRLLITQDAIY
jgi:hypothetical protein